MKIGICAFPLSVGNESGRGLERVIHEFCSYLGPENLTFDIYQNKALKDLKGSASFKNELNSIFSSITYLLMLNRTKNKCYFATYPVAALFPVFLHKKPLVTVVHDLIPFFVKGYDNQVKYSLKRFCIKYACTKSDVLIVPFSSTKQKIIELFHVEEKKIKIIPYGVNHTTYFFDSSIPRKKNAIAFLGEAKRAKGLDSLIKAFAMVRKNIPDATLIIASSGNELKQMQQLAHAFLPTGSYEFVGFIPEGEMHEFYNSCSLFIFPSRYGFGLSALEAMACGVPTIAGATLDSLDFLYDKDILVNPDDIDEIAAKITRLLSDVPLYKEKTRQALEIAGKYSWTIMAEKYYNTCLSLISKNNEETAKIF